MPGAAIATMFAGAALSTLGTRKDREARNKAIQSTLERKGRAFVSENELLEQQRDDIDRELGAVLSSSALEAAKAEATSRAMAASSGAISSDINTEARMSQMLEEQEILRKSKSQDIATLRKQLLNRISFRNEADAIRSGLQTGSQAQLSTVASALQGAKSGLSLLSPATKAKALI